MEQVTIITHEQELLLNKFREDKFLSSRFYFTGGTALSLHYLQHRRSIDLDFFTDAPFDPQVILSIITNWGDELGFSVDYLVIEKTHVFNLIFRNKQAVKVDFAFYPYQQVKNCQMINDIKVDSQMDIAINKLLTIEQRAEVKDFVDLYFLFKEFTIWDLLEGIKLKFKVKIDPFIIGSDFLKVENFDYLPQMLKPLTLKELKAFYKQKAKQITGRFIE